LLITLLSMYLPFHATRPHTLLDARSTYVCFFDSFEVFDGRTAKASDLISGRVLRFVAVLVLVKIRFSCADAGRYGSACC